MRASIEAISGFWVIAVRIAACSRGSGEACAIKVWGTTAIAAAPKKATGILERDSIEKPPRTGPEISGPLQRVGSKLSLESQWRRSRVAGRWGQIESGECEVARSKRVGKWKLHDARRRDVDAVFLHGGGCAVRIRSFQRDAARTAAVGRRSDLDCSFSRRWTAG